MTVLRLKSDGRPTEYPSRLNQQPSVDHLPAGEAAGGDYATSAFILGLGGAFVAALLTGLLLPALLGGVGGTALGLMLAR